MKIILFLPNSTGHKNDSFWIKKKKRMAYAPTTLTVLSGLIPKDLNADIRIIDEGIENIDIDTWDADIVGISVLTANAPYAYKVADKLRMKGITVVLGGVHTSLLPDEASEHADAIVIGYAEKSWPRLLNDFSLGKLGKIYKDDGWREVFQSSSLPPLDRSLLKRKRYILPNTLVATRGCYNKCSFCVIPVFNKSKMSQRPIGCVIDEIKSLSAQNIVFLDSSPTEDIHYSKELMKAMIPLKVKWNGCATTKILNDDEWLSLAKKSGCRGLLIGFESINQMAVNDNRKKFNNVKRYEELVKKLHALKIIILGTFIFGFDQDDKSVFGETLEFVNRAKIDILHFSIATPFPNTPFYDRLKNEDRILHQNWEKYDGLHVVFKPQKMTPQQLKEGFLDLHNKAHSYRSIYKRLSGRYNNLGFNLIANWGFRQYGKYMMQ